MAVSFYSPTQTTSPHRALGDDAGGGSSAVFGAMCLLFFAWGFLATWNDLLIPHFKDQFHLDYLHAMLVQFAFFGGYALGAVGFLARPWIFRHSSSAAPIKGVIVSGLAVCAVGALLFIPAAQTRHYPLFLTALLVIGTGLALVQIAANPCVIDLGPQATASSRLNLAAGCSSVGTALGPLAGAAIIFRASDGASSVPLSSVRLAYVLCAAAFGFFAVTFATISLPSPRNAVPEIRSLSVLKRPGVVLGVVAIFLYVGTEVTLGSSIINFLGLRNIAGMSHEQAGRSLSIYWGGLMVGRFMGAAALSRLRAPFKAGILLVLATAMVLVVAVAFGARSGAYYGVCLMLVLSVFWAGRGHPARTLTLFGSATVLLIATVLLSQGDIARWALLGTGLFCSIMWSNIFSLVLNGLGPLQAQASSLLIMAISGAAVLPPLQGALADRRGLQVSFLIPLLAMFGVTAFALYRAAYDRDTGVLEEGCIVP